MKRYYLPLTLSSLSMFKKVGQKLGSIGGRIDATPQNRWHMGARLRPLPHPWVSNKGRIYIGETLFDS